MMVQKARLFGDEAAEAGVMAAEKPAACKAWGRKVKGFDADTWTAASYDIVVDGNAAKFGQDAGLKSYLLSTGDEVLVEAARNDKIWGIGMDRTDPRANDPRQWDGQNLLGFALMDVREKLRSGEPLGSG